MMYRSRLQRNTVMDCVQFLLQYAEGKDMVITKETLNLICDRYCYVVDPPNTPEFTMENYSEGDCD